MRDCRRSDRGLVQHTRDTASNNSQTAFACWPKVIEDAKLAPVGIEGRQFNPRSRPELLRHFHALNKPAHVVLGDFLQAFQVAELCIHVVIGAVKPIPFPRAAMNPSQRRIALPNSPGPNLVVAWKHLNPLGKTGSAFQWDSQPAGKIVDVDSALLCQERLFHEDPKVTAAARPFKGRVNTVLAKFPLQLEQVFECIPVVRINGQFPLHAVLRISGIKPIIGPSDDLR